MGQRSKAKAGISRRLYDWNNAMPYEFCLNADMLEVCDVISTPKLTTVREVERERRLYLRLYDAVEKLRDGRVRLKEDWREQALTFANLYAPPVVTADIPPYRSDDLDELLEAKRHGRPIAAQIPVSVFGQECLLVWWTVALSRELKRRRRTLFEKLKAVVQVRHFLSSVRTDRGTVSSHPGHWREIAEQMLSAGTRPYRRRRRKFDVLESLPPDMMRERATALRDHLGGDSRRISLLASQTLASVLNVRLTGATLLCLPSTTMGRRGGFSFGLQFLSPLARIWFGLWEDLGGVSLAFCDYCGAPFLRQRKDGKWCSPACNRPGHVRAWRQKERSDRQRAAQREGKAAKHGAKKRARSRRG